MLLPHLTALAVVMPCTSQDIVESREKFLSAGCTHMKVESGQKLVSRNQLASEYTSCCASLNNYSEFILNYPTMTAQC